MKYLRGPIVALLAFLLGVIVSPIHFRVEGWGCGRTLDGGGGFSVTSYALPARMASSTVSVGSRGTKRASQRTQVKVSWYLVRAGSRDPPGQRGHP